jgi:3-oxoacyl-[acyl-carrier protein] reductase
MTTIQGKTALITGASRGIGRAIALELAYHQVKCLLLVARDSRRLHQVATEINQIDPLVKVIVLPLDLTQPVAVNIAIAQAWRDHSPIDILINCAGVAHQTPFLKSQPCQVREEISLNFMGMYTITRLMAKRMATHKKGTIVNVSSLMGKVAAPSMSTYSATKFAILGFTQALRGELAPYNIKVVALLPTLTDTDMTRQLKLFRGVMPVTAEKVAQALISGLNRGKSEILVGWQSHLAVFCQRFAPWLLDKILSISNPLSENAI